MDVRAPGKWRPVIAFSGTPSGQAVLQSSHRFAKKKDDGKEKLLLKKVSLIPRHVGD